MLLSPPWVVSVTASPLGPHRRGHTVDIADPSCEDPLPVPAAFSASFSGSDRSVIAGLSRLGPSRNADRADRLTALIKPTIPVLARAAVLRTVVAGRILSDE